MTREEIKKAIKNGESVWYLKGRTIKQIDLKNTHPIFNGYQIDIMIEDENGWHTEFYGIENLYKTKAEAEHYLRHANVTRTETLPFLTWEEFTSDIMAFNSFSFISDEDFKCNLFYDKENNLIILDKGYEIDTYGATEENFYKAYDECVRLFKEEE